MMNKFIKVFLVCNIMALIMAIIFSGIWSIETTNNICPETNIKVNGKICINEKGEFTVTTKEITQYATFNDTILWVYPLYLIIFNGLAILLTSSKINEMYKNGKE